MLFSGQHLHAAALFPDVLAPQSVAPPWPPIDTEERIDGFTFQGGEVQLLFSNFPTMFFSTLRATVSNCLFDMREGWTSAVPDSTSFSVAGPWFGVMMVKRWSPAAGGYFDQFVTLANNTFVLSEYGATGPIYEANPEAVAIIDVTDPDCTGPGGGMADPVLTLRGVGNPVLLNNLIRTSATGNAVRQRALLGIDTSDTQVAVSSTPAFSGPPYPQANAFAVGREGLPQPQASPPHPANSNCRFFSIPTTSVVVAPGVVNGSPTVGLPALPTPAVPVVFDRAVTTSPPEFDAGFVGEFLGPHTATYVRDFRLLPGSPMIDAGIEVPPGWYFQGAHGRGSQEPVCDTIGAFRWDGEEWGNPRTVGAAPDLGFDEMHLLIAAGSYAEDSRSHNLRLTPPINPSAGTGAATRSFILPLIAGGVTVSQSSIDVHGNLSRFAAPPPAWTLPPGVTNPPMPGIGLPAGYDLRYMTFTDPAPAPTPWSLQYTVQPWTSAAAPSGQAPFIFLLSNLTDVEGNARYFTTQAVVTHPDQGTLWSNLQPEYR